MFATFTSNDEKRIDGDAAYMPLMKQLALDISMASSPTLSRFFVGPNEAVLEHLRHWVGDGQPAQSRTPKTG